MFFVSFVHGREGCYVALSDLIVGKFMGDVFLDFVCVVLA